MSTLGHLCSRLRKLTTRPSMFSALARGRNVTESTRCSAACGYADTARARVVAQVDDCPPAIGVPDQRPVMVCTTRMADGGNADDARTMNGLYCRGRGLWGMGTQGDVRGRPS